MKFIVSVEHGTIGTVAVEREVQLDIGENPHRFIEDELKAMVAQVVTAFNMREGSR